MQGCAPVTDPKLTSQWPHESPHKSQHAPVTTYSWKISSHSIWVRSYFEKSRVESKWREQRKENRMLLLPHWMQTEPGGLKVLLLYHTFLLGFPGFQFLPLPGLYRKKMPAVCSYHRNPLPPSPPPLPSLLPLKIKKNLTIYHVTLYLKEPPPPYP